MFKPFARGFAQHLGSLRRRRVSLYLGALIGLIPALGCPGSGDRGSAKPSSRVRVRAFSEPAPVRVMIGTSDYAFAASREGLVRWSLREDTALELNADHGLPGDRVEDMAYDRDRGWLWIATNAGLTRYEIDTGTFSEVPAAPSVLGVDSLSGVILAPAGDGGVWIGHRLGLFYSNLDGDWTPTGVKAPVTALHRTADGALWIGTAEGLVGRQPNGDTFRYDRDQRCDLARVRFIVSAPGGGPLIVGENADDEQRIVLLMRSQCVTFRASPSIRWHSAARRGDELIVLGGGRLYSLRTPRSGARRLLRVGMRLLPVQVSTSGDEVGEGQDGEGGEGGEDAPKSPYVIQTLDVRVPHGARLVSTSNDEILLGTRDLGIARIAAGAKRARWLRQGGLVAGATSLSVACAAKDRCYIATGTSTAWRFDGKGFVALDSSGAPVLAFARSQRGGIYALVYRSGTDGITIAQVEQGVISDMEGLIIQTPGKPRSTFAEFDPRGRLWVGLQFREDDELRPFGVAVVDVRARKVIYHRAVRDGEPGPEPVLPLPPSVAGIAFQDPGRVWLATSEGAARLEGEEIKIFGENNGLNTERLHGVACAASGAVYVGSSRGVEVYEKGGWRQVRALKFTVNDMTLGSDGRLWLATERGIARYDGAGVRWLDVRRGLFENQIDDITSDRFGRIWARSQHGFTIVVP